MRTTITTNRRALLTGIGAAAAAAAIGGGYASALPSLDKLRIDPDMLRASIEGLSIYGRPSGGAFADGVSRYAYSDADVAGRTFAMQLIRKAGAEPRIDTAGNIFARLDGREKDAKPIVIGSHIDTVPSGGNFDGIVGSLSSIEILRVLKASNARLRHPLQVAIWANEEGGTVGSGHASGRIDPERLARLSNGIRTADGIRKIGGDPTRLKEAVIPAGSLHCYLELHIEQGGTLEKMGVPIGVVEGIVTTRGFDVEVIGFANHAGATPMNDRQDALIAASKLVVAVNEEVRRLPGRQVGTVGKFDVFPNVTNIVPGNVKLNIGMRDLDGDKLDMIADRIVQRAKAIEAETRTQIVLNPRGRDGKAALATPFVESQIEAASAAMGLKTFRMPSAAGHDADPMSKLTQMGMIFIPSVNGISHSPKEFSKWEDVANGANVLFETVRRMDLA